MLAEVEPGRGRHVHVAVAVVHAMEPPQERNGVLARCQTYIQPSSRTKASAKRIGSSRPSRLRTPYWFASVQPPPSPCEAKASPRMTVLNQGDGEVVTGVAQAASALAKSEPVRRSQPARLDEPIRFALALVLLDGWMYVWHRANHTIPLLWRFHRMHHSDRHMDVTTATGSTSASIWGGRPAPGPDPASRVRRLGARGVRQPPHRHHAISPRRHFHRPVGPLGAMADRHAVHAQGPPF